MYPKDITIGSVVLYQNYEWEITSFEKKKGLGVAYMEWKLQKFLLVKKFDIMIYCLVRYCRISVSQPVLIAFIHTIDSLRMCNFFLS